MLRLRTDFKNVRNRKKEINKAREFFPTGSDAEVLQLVPEKSIVDAKVTLYFQTFETSYRIFHEPTFRSEYQTFWEQQHSGEATATFAAILVLIVALTKCLDMSGTNVFVGDSSADREAASDLIEACTMWLSRQSRKHLTLHLFQLHCLCLLAKRLNCLKVKQDWVASGDVVRFAMASGMHRNPSLILKGKLSEFEKEMRRRLWATIMELELHSSIECGLPSSLCGLYFDTQPPANIPDEAFGADTAQAPSGRPIDHFTSTSYLIISLRSLPLRVHLMQLINNPTANLQYSDVMHYDARINSLLSSIPDWNDPRSTIASALLDLQLRQFLLLLHRPYGKVASTNSHYMYSFTACVDAASKILSIYEDLNNKGIVALNHLRNDALRIAVTLSQVVYFNCVSSATSEQILARNVPNSNISDLSGCVGRNSQGQNPTSATPAFKVAQLPHQNFLAATLCASGISLVERAHTTYEQKVMRLGTGYMEYWLVLASIAILPPSTSSLPITSIASITNNDDLRSRIRKAIDRFTTLAFRVLAMQKDPANSFSSSLRSTIASSTPGDIRTPVSNIVVSTGTPRGMGDGYSPLPTILPGASAMASALSDREKGPIPELQGPWDALQDMQIDMTGWSFPDFWGFDVGGDL